MTEQHKTVFRSDAADGAPQAQAAVILVKLDGKEYVQGSPLHVGALESRIDSLLTASGESKAKLDAAVAKVAELESKLKAVDVNALVQDELAFRQSVLPALAKGYDFAGKTRDQVRADAVGAAVIADAAKLASDAERAGYIAAHLKIKLDSVGKTTTSSTTPPGRIIRSDSTRC